MMGPAARCLSRAIAAQGPLPFSTFMHHALYHPEWGYYMRAPSPFHTAGDFTTAPEQGPFLAHSLIPVWQRLCHHIPQAPILELGCGTGQLAFDLMQGLLDRGLSPPAYHLVEVSPARQAEQRQRLSHLPAACRTQLHWHTQWPWAWEGLVIANELLDALVVDVVCWHQNQWSMACVDLPTGEERFQWTLQPHPDPHRLDYLAPHVPHWPSLYQTEHHVGVLRWLADDLSQLARGAVLLIDYGHVDTVYHSPERHMGTLMAHHRHTAHGDVLAAPGEHDITSHINFSQIASFPHGLDLQFFCPQSEFLLYHDVLHHPLARTPLGQRTLPWLLMDTGERFHVMALSRHCPEALCPDLRDHRHRL